MNIKLLKKGNKFYLPFPDNYSGPEDVELFQLRDSYWLVSPQLRGSARVREPEKPRPRISFSPEDEGVLGKLLEIKFENRIPSKIEKLFSASEQGVIRQLIKKGYVQVFYGGKYTKTGVYNISNSVFPFIVRERLETAESAQKMHVEKPQAISLPPRPSPKMEEPEQRPQATQFAQIHVPSYSELQKKGWLVIPDSRTAEQFSYELKKSGLASKVKGVRGFDGKFYVATADFIYSAYEKVRAALEKKDMYLPEISAAVGIDPEGILSVLRVLAESGEIIEKKRGLFCLA